MIDAGHISSFFEAAERDASLYHDRSFSRRADIIDDLEFYLAHDNNEPALKHRAENLRARLEQVDDKLFDTLRTDIRSGKYRQRSFRKLLEEYTGEDASGLLKDQPQYDNLDVFINRLFPFAEIPEPSETPEPEMVFYQKTPARVVLELADRWSFTEDDVFVDIGSGLGQVAILVNLLAGIKTIGIEFDPAFCEYARASAASLDLADVTFINSDARRADYSQGTVFFMFTPFKGQMLFDVLEQLRTEAQTRKIKLITYGPCSAEIARMAWLIPDDHRPEDIYSAAFFHSCSASR